MPALATLDPSLAPFTDNMQTLHSQQNPSLRSTTLSGFLPPFHYSLSASRAPHRNAGSEAEEHWQSSGSLSLTGAVEAYDWSGQATNADEPEDDDLDGEWDDLTAEGAPIGLLWVHLGKETQSVRVAQASRTPMVSQVAQELLSQDLQRVEYLSLPAPGSDEAYKLDALRSFPSTREQATGIFARRVQWAAKLVLSEIGRPDIRVVALPRGTVWRPETHLSTAI